MDITLSTLRLTFFILVTAVAAKTVCRVGETTAVESLYCAKSDPVFWSDALHDDLTDWDTTCVSLHSLERDLRLRLLSLQWLDAVVYSFPKFFHPLLNDEQEASVDWSQVGELTAERRRWTSVHLLHLSGEAEVRSLMSFLKTVFEDTISLAMAQRRIAQALSPLNTVAQQLNWSLHVPSEYLQYPHRQYPIPPIPPQFLSPVFIRVGYSDSCPTCSIVRDAAHRLSQVVGALCQLNMHPVTSCAPAIYVVESPVQGGFLMPQVTVEVPQRLVYRVDENTFIPRPSFRVHVSNGVDVVDWVDDIILALVENNIVQFTFMSETEIRAQENRLAQRMRERAREAAAWQGARSLNGTLWKRLKAMSKETKLKHSQDVHFLFSEDLLDSFTMDERAGVQRMRAAHETISKSLSDEATFNAYWNSLSPQTQGHFSKKSDRSSMSLTELIERLSMSTDIETALNFSQPIRTVADTPLDLPSAVHNAVTNGLIVVMGVCVAMCVARQLRDRFIQFRRSRRTNPDV